MRRTPVLVPLLLLALLPAPAAAEHAGERPPLRAALAACSTGASEDERFAVFTGSMPARKGTRRMAVRFDLQERSGPGASWRRIAAPAFGRWEKSEPGRAGLEWVKRLERLRDGRQYRSVVRFRWYAASGAVQAERRRTTPVCAQPDARADLRVESVGVVPGRDEGTSTYLVTVVNDGQTAAEAFGVAVDAGGEPASRPVPGLAAGERTTVEVVAGRCAAGATAVATVDPADAVDEADEADNALRKACDGG